MKRLVLGALIVGSTAAGVPPVFADASDLLMRMDKAFVNLSYDGVFTYFSGNDLTALRLVHKVVDGEQRERLVHLNGAPREIVRRGDEVACFVMPGDDLLALEESIPAGPFARAFVRQFDRLSGTYAVEQAGEGRVADRSAHRVAVTPKDEHRYGYRLWLDQATALLLRSELVDREGNRLEIFQFNQIEIGDTVKNIALDAGELTGSKVSHLRLAGASAGNISAADETPPMRWHTGWLSPGFEMATADIRRKPATASSVSTLMYTDGLATFSVFVETMPEGGAASMVTRNGATVAITRRIDADGEYFLATLVGEIPEATGQQIIRSIVHK